MGDFSFTFGAFADAFFEGRSLSEDERSSGDGFEVLRFENNMILVVVSISDLMFGKAGECHEFAIGILILSQFFCIFLDLHALSHQTPGQVLVHNVELRLDTT